MNNLKNVIMEPTRVTDTTATLIDPILVSESSGVFDSGVIEIPNHISDHRATFLLCPFQLYSSKCILGTFKNATSSFSDITI